MVAICSQQSKEGGILAGHPYHLAYVRDQYGGARGLLRMGCVAEARRILEHYRHIFSHNGRICNAQAMGVEGIVHFHENDNVEITGYLVRAAFDLFEKEKDEAFLCSLLPMLLWAVKAQIGELKDGMLPFNGDETYVAGESSPERCSTMGLLSTMLFIDGTERFLDFFGTRLEPVCAKEIRSALEDTKANFLSFSSQWPVDYKQSPAQTGTGFSPLSSRSMPWMGDRFSLPDVRMGKACGKRCLFVSSVYCRWCTASMGG